MPPDEKRLATLYSDIFLLGTHIRCTRDLGSADSLRRQIIRMFDAADRKGDGLPKETLLQARYAVAAFIDEMISSSSWVGREEWTPLQYEFFNEHTAGVEFFNRLTAVRQAMPSNPSLLSVYYTCLLLGFEGQYKLYGAEKLAALMEGLQKEMVSHQAPSLSPHGKRPDELMNSIRQEVPAWVVLVSCLFVIMVCFLTLSPLIWHDAKSTADRLTQLRSSVKP